MKDTIDVRGASGAVYRFMRVRADQTLSRMGGNFIYAKTSEETLEIVFVGEAPNLMADAHRLWSQAVQDYGAEELFTRLNVTERIRRLEQSDILGAVKPPMNAETSTN
ncbi:MAG TPA: hypothetical protein VGH03_21030 [Caulobacteraceae bacterium]|jgi:hypothetical protein